MFSSTRSSSKIHEYVGFPVNLSQNVLPTNGDVLRGFYYIRQQQMQTTDHVPSGNETNAELVPAIMNLWVKASLPQTTDKRVAQMIKELLNKLKSIQSHPKDRLQSIFGMRLNRLQFYKSIQTSSGRTTASNDFNLL